MSTPATTIERPAPSRTLRGRYKPVLVAVAVFVLIVGSVTGWRLYSTSRLRNLLEQLKAKGATWELHARPDAWVGRWDNQLPGFVKDLFTAQEISLTLNGTRLDVETMKVIAALPELVSLQFDNTPTLTDNLLGVIIRVRTLQSVIMNKTRVTDAGLRHFALLPRLERLGVSNSHITLDGLLYLGGLQHLQVARLNGRGGSMVTVEPLTLSVVKKRATDGWNSSTITIRGSFSTTTPLPAKLKVRVRCQGQGRDFSLEGDLLARGDGGYEFTATATRPFVPHGVYELAIILPVCTGSRVIEGAIDRRLVAAEIKETTSY